MPLWAAKSPRAIAPAAQSGLPKREPDQFGSANTHSTEPPSGFLISGVSVESDLARPDPLPTATATYCLPLAVKLIGNELMALFKRICQSTWPLVSSRAR